MATDRITPDEIVDITSRAAERDGGPRHLRAPRRHDTISSALALTSLAAASGAELSSEPADAAEVAGDKHLAPVAALMHREGTYRRLLASADGLGALAAVVAWGALSGNAWRWTFVLVPLIAITVGKVQGLYDRDDMVLHKSTLNEWRQVARAAFIVAMGIYLIWYASTAASAGRGIRPFIFFMVATFVLTLPLRAAARAIARRTTDDEKVLVIGTPNRCEQLAGRLQRVPHTELIGLIDNAGIDPSVPGLYELVEQLEVQRIVIGPYPSHAENSILRLIASAKWLGVRVSLMPSIMAVVGANTVVDELDTMILLGVPRFGLSRSSALVKRIFDLVIATCVLIAAAPAFLILAIAIRCDSEGPVFFRQKRVGRDGKSFTMYKFRSMVQDAEQLRASLDSQNQTNGLFKMEDDPRVTRVGTLIRKTYLDELPQLLNVLKGDMSLVGPRPLIESEDALLTGIDRHRSCLPPGMTGPWQLRGPIDASLSELAKLDYHYASSWSVWNDLDILIGTAARVFTRHGH